MGQMTVAQLSLEVMDALPKHVRCHAFAVAHSYLLLHITNVFDISILSHCKVVGNHQQASGATIIAHARTYTLSRSAHVL